MATKKSKSKSPVIAVIDALPDPAFLLDDKGTILHANPPFEKILQIKLKDIQGKHALKAEFLPQEVQKLLKKRFKKLEEGSSVKPLAPHEIHFHTSEGADKYMEFSASSFEYEGSKADIVILHDITELKRPEENQFSEEVSAPIQEDTSDIILMLDKEASIVYSSLSITSILGYQLEELTNKKALELVHPDDSSLITDYFIPESPIDYGTSVQFRLLCADGSWRYVELAGKNVIDDPSAEGIVLRLRDISEWRQSQDELRETEGKFQAIFENANDAIVYFDMSGTVIDVNAKVYDILGYNVEDVVGKPFTEIGLIPPENLDEIVTHFNEASKGYFNPTSELEVKRKDGSVISIGVSSGIVGSENRPDGLFVIIRDITKSKKAEARIEHLNTILRAIRHVNQLIIREKDSSRLIQSACDTLIKTHGYKSAWIVLPDDFGVITAGAEAGMEELFAPLKNSINSGQWPQCAQLALAQSGVLITKVFSDYCSKCPIVSICSERGALTIRLEHDNNVSGVFCVSGLGDDDITEEEIGLFEETANDIAFALYSISTSGERDEAETRVRAQNEEIQLQFYELEKTNTDLKQAQKKLLNSNQMLRESEEKYRNLVENAGAPILYFGRNGRILTINTLAAANLQGIPSDYIGKSIYDLFPQISDGLMQRLRTVIESEESKEFEDFFELPTGKFWFRTGMYPVKDASDRTFAVQTIARDITEQKRAEEAVKTSEARFRALLERSSDGISIINADGSFGYEGPVNDRILGYEGDEAVFDSIFDVIYSDDTSKLTIDFANLMEQHGSLITSTYRAHHKDGSLRTIEVIGRNLVDDPLINGVIVNFRDITKRQQAEEALAQSEKRFRALIEKSSDGIAIVDQNGEIIYTGPTNDIILGYEPNETTFTSMLDTIHSEDKPKIVADFADLMCQKGITLTNTYRSLHKDGSWRTLEVVGRNLVDDPAINGIVVNFRDVTKRRMAEEAVIASEKKFKEIFENVSDEIMYLDKFGTIVDVNRRSKDIFGYEPEELIGKNFTDFQFASEEDMPRIAKVFNEVVGSGKTSLVEIKSVRKDGSFVFVEVSPSIIEGDREIQGLLIVARDITKRKQAEELFETLATNSQIGTYIVQDGKFQFVNPAFIKALGLEQDEAENMLSINLVHPDDRENVREEAINMLKGQSSTGYEFRAMTKDGSIKYAYEKVISIDYQGRPAVLGSYMDITERKHAEEKLSQYRAELEQNLDELQRAYAQLQEMDELKDNFLSTVSHELRTPLTSIKSFTEILLTYEDDRETQKEFLTIINEESDRLTRLVNDFLDLSKIEAGRMQWETTLVDIPNIIESAVSTIRTIADSANLIITIESDPDLPNVWGDNDRFTQVITNLLSNAIKFTPKGGSIIVRSELMESDTSLTEPDMLKVSVIDTGGGLAPEEHDLVFERFMQVSDTLKGKPQGTGLGLPICKEIVEHYGGTIWVESEPGKGSTFAFTTPIPQELDEQTRVDEHPLLPENARETGNTILVVDDEANIRRFLNHELSQKGYRVLEAANGREAIEMVKTHLPNLITLDVVLPDISGIEIASKLKDDPDTRHIPILIISVLEDKEGAHKAGVNDYITKPFKGETILEKISLLLRNPKGTILVVDDDKALVESITHDLNHKGFSTSVAHDGEEALRVIQSNPPDLIILDIMMPKMDGHQVIKELKKKPKTAHIPIIVLTGVEIDGEQITTLSLEATDYITKSGGLSKLFESAANILANRSDS